MQILAEDMEGVNALIRARMASKHAPRIPEVTAHLVEAGGKRLRPLLTLAAAKLCGYDGPYHVHLAATVEFIHTATLLHDDVVDMSTLRRGRPTVNAEWNNPSSVLVGDFIYSRAFQMLVRIGDMRIMQLIADTTNKIAEGEVLQLITKHNAASSEANYMQVIRDKTAILFKAAAQCGAILSQADSATEKALTNFGMHLGTAFQLIDDVLDYAGDSSALGKNIGDDLAEGKPTLPLIYAMAQGSEQQSRLIRETLTADEVSAELLPEVIEVVQNSGTAALLPSIGPSTSLAGTGMSVHVARLGLPQGIANHGRVLTTSFQLKLRASCAVQITRKSERKPCPS